MEAQNIVESRAIISKRVRRTIEVIFDLAQNQKNDKQQDAQSKVKDLCSTQTY